MPDTKSLLSHFFVAIDGTNAPDEFYEALVTIVVENSLHLPDVATLTLHDSRLRWIDDASLAPGKAIKVSAQAGPDEKPLFDGEIVEVEPDFTPSAQRLVVRAFDRLHRLARGQHTCSFLNVSDGDLVQKIAQEVGLQAQVGPTSQIHPYVFQYNETNLAFLQERAAALGYLLYVQGKTLHCQAPQSDGQAIELEWGVTLSEFHPRLTTIGQLDGVTVKGWDPAARQEIVGQAQNGHGAPQVGDSKSGGELAHAAFNLGAQRLVADRPIRTQTAADRLAQAVADRHAGHFIEAEGVCGGNPALVAGAPVKIGAVGDRFSGTYFVTSTTHTYTADQGYSTQFTVSGLHPSTLLSLLTPQAPPPTSTGLVIGVVTDNQDPDGQGRVKVKYPWLSSDHASDWARVVVPGGGAERGIEFLPEVNDEVLVGFEMGDVHYPYVMGGLWNGRDAPPTKSNQLVSGGKVQKRIIRSRSGHTITLDDSNGGGGITVEDKNGNKLALDSSANKLAIEVKGDASVKAQGNLTIEAQGQVQIKGMGVKVDGGAATVDVKGTMINLN
jgi:phage protein D